MPPIISMDTSSGHLQANIYCSFSSVYCILIAKEVIENAILYRSYLAFAIPAMRPLVSTALKGQILSEEDTFLLTRRLILSGLGQVSSGTLKGRVQMIHLRSEMKEP